MRVSIIPFRRPWFDIATEIAGKRPFTEGGPRCRRTLAGGGEQLRVDSWAAGPLQLRSRLGAIWGPTDRVLRGSGDRRV